MLYQEQQKLESEANKNIEYNKSKEKEIKEPEIIKKMLKKMVIKEKIRSNKPNDFGKRLKPSGSNFEIIHPEVGVKIKEEANEKSGGYNYFEKYNRFSIHDYNKTLKNTSENIKNKIINIKLKQNELFNNTTAFSNLSLIKEKENIENNNDDDISLNPNKEEINERLFRKTFNNKINLIDIKKKFIAKSKSDISLNNHNSNSLREILASKENEINNFKLKYFINNNVNDFHNYYDINNNELTFNKILNRKIYSPTPTNKINSNENSFLTNNINSEINNNYTIINNFNYNILKGEFNKLNENRKESNNKGILLPKILLKNNKSKQRLKKNYFNRTNNYFYRTLKKKFDVENHSKFNL